MNWIIRLIGRMVNFFKPFPTEEYYECFVLPAWRRGWALGIPDRELTEMWDWAWDNAEPTTIGFAPMALFHRRMDEWERAHKMIDGLSE